MDKEFFEKAKTILKQTADDLSLELVSVRNYNSEDGEILEVLIDKDFSITLKEIEEFTEIVNPLLDKIEIDTPSYTLDISSSGSARLIKFSELHKLIGRWLDIELNNDESNTMMLDSVENNVAYLHYFIKGKKKKVELKEDDIKQIHIGYKA